MAKKKRKKKADLENTFFQAFYWRKDKTLITSPLIHGFKAVIKWVEDTALPDEEVDFTIPKRGDKKTLPKGIHIERVLG